MPERMDKNHPIIQKEIHALIDEAMRARGINVTDPVGEELLSRSHLDFGYRDQPVIRFCASDGAVLSATDCLDRLLSDSEDTTSTPPGPKRIAYTDHEAVIHADVEKIAKGEVIVFDDRRHPH